VNSVKWYARQIYVKLGIENRRQVAARASELGLLTMAPIGVKSSSLPTGTVTFLFTDIEGSTPLWERMPKDMKVSVAQHHSLIRQAIESNGGQVFQVIGDAFQSAFSLASQGVCAALAAQRSLQAALWGPTGPLKVRMGLHTGPAELDQSGNAPYAVSHTLNRAARVMSAAHGGQILLSQETADLVVRELPEGVDLLNLGEHRLKGMEWPEHLYQLIAPDLRNFLRSSRKG
jgi:class 3 adenylate cyclase